MFGSRMPFDFCQKLIYSSVAQRQLTVRRRQLVGSTIYVLLHFDAFMCGASLQAKRREQNM
jgi:hypothetical protein